MMRWISDSMHPLEYERQHNHTCAGHGGMKHFLSDHMHAPCQHGSRHFAVEEMEKHCRIRSSPQGNPLPRGLWLSHDIAEPWEKGSSHHWFWQVPCIPAKVLLNVRRHSHSQSHYQICHPEMVSISDSTYISVYSIPRRWVQYPLVYLSVNTVAKQSWMLSIPWPFSDWGRTWRVRDDEKIFAVDMNGQRITIEYQSAPYLC